MITFLAGLLVTAVFSIALYGLYVVIQAYRKDSGIDEAREVKEILAQTIKNDEIAYETLRLHNEKEIAKLKAQIEKMKCCGNCSHFKLDNSGLYPINVCELTYQNRCKNFNKWELAND